MFLLLGEMCLGIGMKFCHASISSSVLCSPSNLGYSFTFAQIRRQGRCDAHYPTSICSQEESYDGKLICKDFEGVSSISSRTFCIELHQLFVN